MNRYAYDESGRRRWVLIAGAVLAIVALLVVAFIAGRSTAPAGAGRSQVVNVQSGPGPTRVVNGVPVGHAHTQAGAVAAATNYLIVIQGPYLTQPDQYRTAIDTMAVPSASETLHSYTDRLLTQVQSGLSLSSYALQGRAVVARFVPLSYQVDRSSSDSADISIWGEGLIAIDGVLAVHEAWGTSALSVEWSAGDWKLTGYSASSPDSYGPVPTTVQAPTQGLTLPPQLARYRSYATTVIQ